MIGFGYGEEELMLGRQESIPIPSLAKGQGRHSDPSPHGEGNGISKYR